MLSFLKESYIYIILRHFSIENSKKSFYFSGWNYLVSSQVILTLNEIKKNETSSVIGSLMYAMMWIKLDISFVIGIEAWYHINHGQGHWIGKEYTIVLEED